MKTDKLGFGEQSKPFGTVNICGFEVEIRKVSIVAFSSHFCAYAKLKGSKALSESDLGYPTFKQGDWVGIDTAHHFNMTQTEAEKLYDALIQIEGVIRAYQKAMKRRKHK